MNTAHYYLVACIVTVAFFALMVLVGAPTRPSETLPVTNFAVNTSSNPNDQTGSSARAQVLAATKDQDNNMVASDDNNDSSLIAK